MEIPLSLVLFMINQKLILLHGNKQTVVLLLVIFPFIKTSVDKGPDFKLIQNT